MYLFKIHIFGLLFFLSVFSAFADCQQSTWELGVISQMQAQLSDSAKRANQKYHSIKNDADSSELANQSVVSYLQSRKVILIGGVLSHLVHATQNLTGVEYFGPQVRWLKENNIEYEVIRVDSFDTSVDNQHPIADAISLARNLKCLRTTANTLDQQ